MRQGRLLAAGRALYFSRSPIPHHRDGLPGRETDPPGSSASRSLRLPPRFSASTRQLPRSPLETTEKLEQLRVLEAGIPIAVGIVDEPSVGIDTPEDYRRFVERYRSQPRQPIKEQ